MRAPGDRVLKGQRGKKRRSTRSRTGLVVGDSIQVFCYPVKAETSVERLRRRNSISYEDLATASPHAPWLFRWTWIPLITFSIFNPYSCLQPQ